MTFWLSAPQPQTVTVRAETEVSTDRTDVEEPIVFSTTETAGHRAVFARIGPGGNRFRDGRARRSTQ